MEPERKFTYDQAALERAAKYICTAKCGVCPLMVEKFTCPTVCGTDTLPWQCWLAFFKKGMESG